MDCIRKFNARRKMRAAVTAVKLSNIFGRDSESTKRSNDSNSQNQNSSSEEVKLEIRSEPKSEGESDVEDEKLLKREVERVNYLKIAPFHPFSEGIRLVARSDSIAKFRYLQKIRFERCDVIRSSRFGARQRSRISQVQLIRRVEDSYYSN